MPICDKPPNRPVWPRYLQACRRQPNAAGTRLEVPAKAVARCGGLSMLQALLAALRFVAIGCPSFLSGRRGMARLNRMAHHMISDRMSKGSFEQNARVKQERHGMLLSGRHLNFLGPPCGCLRITSRPLTAQFSSPHENVRATTAMRSV
jgi:hypothetical protein